MAHTRLTVTAVTLALACVVPSASLAATHSHHHRCKRHGCHADTSPRQATRRAIATVRHASPAVAIASVLAIPCANTELTPRQENLEAVRVATLCLINQERARNNELPLKVDARLEATAQRHSELMVNEDYFAHVTPAGETPTQRFEAAGYIPNHQVGYVVGENIAWGSLSLATPQAIVAAWIASPEHLANILEASYTETGLGVVAAVPASVSAGQPGAIYTEDFGVIDE
jgi:uncharacterized protein YkwD